MPRLAAKRDGSVRLKEELAHRDYDQQRSPDVSDSGPGTEVRLKRGRRVVMTHKVAFLDLCSRGA